MIYSYNHNHYYYTFLHNVIIICFHYILIVYEYLPKYHSFKSGSRPSRRHLTFNWTDPLALDYNGYVRGTFYVGVFGKCTPSKYVKNNATDAPCLYASNVHFNLTVKVDLGKLFIEHIV